MMYDKNKPLTTMLKIEPFYIKDILIDMDYVEKWLNKNNYQIEEGEQEYMMFYDVDIPHICLSFYLHLESLK